MKANMKIILAAFSAAIICLSASAQGKIETKKFRIADFQDRITKVVMTGNEFTDAALKQEVMNYWTLSAYEFCSLAEFEATKTRADSYFMIITEGKFKAETEAGINFLCVFKGGPEASGGFDKMLEVASAPLGQTSGGSGRETVFIGAILNVMQGYIRKAMVNELNAYSGFGSCAVPKKLSTKRIFLSEDDIDESVDKAFLEKHLDEDVLVMEEDEADEAFSDMTFNTAVGYVVAPASPVKGSCCYKMIFSADSHELLYYSKHKISPRNGAGFLTDDIKKICSKR